MTSHPNISRDFAFEVEEGCDCDTVFNGLGGRLDIGGNG